MGREKTSAAPANRKLAAAVSLFFIGFLIACCWSEFGASVSRAQQPAAAAADESGGGMSPRQDPAKIVAADKCGDCHRSETETWSKTHHSQTWNTLHKKPEAKEIATKMGFDSIKRNDLCLNCHYTVQAKDEGPTPIAGVSCQSCHGAAADWLPVHNDFGAGATKQTESAEHKAMRHKAADEKGMVRKDRVEGIARNCFNCHTVPNEKLVNTGGHKAGSDFELVAWSQGEVRHNFMDGPQNRPETKERLRVLYVVGRATDLEYTLRAATKVTEKGPFRDAVLARIRDTTIKMDEALKAVPIAEYKAVLDAVPRSDTGALKIAGAKELLESLPPKLAAASEEFVKKHDGTDLAAIDPLLPAPTAYKGESHP